jgi:hypothetical protein
MFRRERVHIGHFGIARLAPSREQIDDDHPIAVIRQPENGTVHGYKRQIKRDVRRKRQAVGSMDVMPTVVARVATGSQRQYTGRAGEKSGPRTHTLTIPQDLRRLTKVNARSYAYRRDLLRERFVE